LSRGTSDEQPARDRRPLHGPLERAGSSPASGEHPGLWAPNGAQVLVDPPREARAAADQLLFRKPSFEVHGYEALAARATRAYETFIEPGNFVFRSRGVTALLPDVVAVGWEVVSTKEGAHAGGGVDILDLDDDGRIVTDFQFIER
jgi:hypothetical protein